MILTTRREEDREEELTGSADEAGPMPGIVACSEAGVERVARKQAARHSEATIQAGCTERREGWRKA